MGFFKNIFRHVTPLKAVAAIGSPVQGFLHTLRGETAEKARGYGELVAGAALTVFAPPVAAAVAGATAVQTAFTPRSNYIDTLPANSEPYIPPGMDTQGVNPMAIDIRQVLGTVGTIFGGNQNPYFQGISGVANIASQFVQPVVQRMPTPGAGVPMVPRNPYGGAAGRALGSVGRGFFNKYPNLAAGMNALRMAGRNIKRSQLYSMLKRFGPDLLITGGILSAAAIAELMQAGPGHRRMNAGNAKALRRSLRRLDAFHHLCVRADKYRKGGARRSKPCKTGSGTQFVRQG